MSDILRLVRLSAGGRPVTVRDLENGSTFAKVGKTFGVVEGNRKQQQATVARRYAGSRATGESQENATIQWMSLVSGANVADQTCANADAMLADFEAWTPGLLVEFRPDGASRSTFFDVRGPASWVPHYDWAQFAGARSITVDVQVPVAPVALLAPCDILDDFSVDSTADYTFDANQSGFSIAGGAVVPVAGGGGTYQATALALTPSLYWRHGETVGTTANDLSGNGRTGTYQAGVTLGATGLLAADADKAISGDGTANAKVTSTYNPFTGNLTICGWANATSLAAARNLFGGSAGTGPLLQIQTNGDVIWWSDLAAATQTWATAWPGAAQTVFWALTWNNATKTSELFINGVSKGTKVSVNAFNAAPGTFTLAGSGAANGFLGPMDETLLFAGTILSSGQVSTLYAAGVGGFTTEVRARHTARGYKHLEHQETLKFTPGATITNFKAGRTLCGSDDNNRVEVYVDDNGTNSRLRIDAIVAGVRTNRSSTNLAARVVNGTAAWVRGRREGDVIIAEYFTLASFPNGPTPMGTPTLTASYTLAAGEITALVAGYGGFSWIPQDAAARLDDYESLPRTYRNQTLPGVLQMRDQVPGTAPALMDVTVTPSGGAAAPVWAMLAWSKRAGAPVSGAVAPFGIIPAETGTSLSGWAVTADATYRGGSGLKVTTAGAATFTASYGLDPSTLPADAFTDGELRVEVMARVDLASTLVSPTLKVTLQPGPGLNFGAERPTFEWGAGGKLLTKPSSGSAKRQVLLGTLSMTVDQALKWNLVLTGTVAAGSTGTYGIDDLFLVLRRQRALQATSKPNDSTFPKFVASTNETSKTISSQLRGRVSQPPGKTYPDAGMGGAVMEVPPGALDLIVELSSLVPDDPTSDTTSEQLSHSGTLHVAVTPRIFLFRGT
jgi:hypothetical protein